MLSTTRFVCYFELVAIKKNSVIRRNISNLSDYTLDKFKQSLHSDCYCHFAIIKHDNGAEFETPLTTLFSQERLREFGLYSKG